MTDAEQMTVPATVPGLEVREVLAKGMWSVWVGGVRLTGLVYLRPNGCFFATLNNQDSPDFQTRNEAVQWLLDMHKEAGE